MNDEEQLEHEATPPTPEEAEALAADKAKYGALKEAELEAHDEKARQVFKAQLPEQLAAKKREVTGKQDDCDDKAASSAAVGPADTAVHQRYETLTGRAAASHATPQQTLPSQEQQHQFDPDAADPAPGSEAAKHRIRDAIRQGQ